LYPKFKTHRVFFSEQQQVHTTILETASCAGCFCSILQLSLLQKY
jgi:hypothetical protein